MAYTYALADISETSDNSDLAGEHDISSALDTVDQRFTASVVVVKLGLGDGIVNVNSGDLQLAITEHLVEVVNTGGGLLRQTADI